MKVKQDVGGFEVGMHGRCVALVEVDEVGGHVLHYLQARCLMLQSFGICVNANTNIKGEGSKLESAKWVSNEVATIFAIDAMVATTIYVDTNIIVA